MEKKEEKKVSINFEDIEEFEIWIDNPEMWIHHKEYVNGFNILMKDGTEYVYRGEMKEIEEENK